MQPQGPGFFWKWMQPESPTFLRKWMKPESATRRCGILIPRYNPGLRVPTFTEPDDDDEGTKKGPLVSEEPKVNRRTALVYAACAISLHEAIGISITRPPSASSSLARS